MTDAVLNITLTDAGMAAVAAAHGQGVAAKITHVAVGDVGHVSSAAATALVSEKARVALIAGGALGANQVLLQGLFPAGGAEFFIREIGYFLEDGTLLGIWSDPVTPLGWLGGTTPWFFKFAFAWSVLPDNSITVVIADDAGQAGMALDLAQLEGKVRHTVEAGALIWDGADDTQLTNAVLALIADNAPAPADATTAVKGIVRLATPAEAAARAAGDIAVTPVGLDAALDALPNTLGRRTIYVPAGAMVASASNGAGLYNAAPNGGANTVKGWSFSDTVDQSTCFGVWMPKSWNRTLLHVRLAWLRLGATAGAVKFKVEALARTHAGVTAHSFAGAVTALTVSAAQDAGQHCETAEMALDLTGAMESAWIDIRLTRMASDTAADTLAEAAIVIGHDVFYTTATATDD